MYKSRIVVHIRPDNIVLKEKKKSITYLIDIAGPGTNAMVNTIQKKMNKEKAGKRNSADLEDEDENPANSYDRSRSYTKENC